VLDLLLPEPSDFVMIRGHLDFERLYHPHEAHFHCAGIIHIRE